MGGTLEEVVEGDGLGVIGVEIVPVDFGLEYFALGFVGLLEFDDEEGVGDGDEVEVGEVAAAEEEFEFFGFVLAHE